MATMTVEKTTVATPVATVTRKETTAVAALTMEQTTVATAMASATATRAAVASAARAASAICGHRGAGTQRHHENDTVHAEYLLRTEKENQPMLLENTCHRVELPSSTRS